MTSSIGEQPSGQWWKSLAARPVPVDLKTDQAHSARMYDYYLGGKDHFPADREAAERALTVFPNARLVSQQNRAFMVRATRHLAGELGIRQFLDIGTGIPTSPNLHEVAQSVAADSTVVYADNDPIVLAHARALLTGDARGHTAYLDADIRDVERILTAPALRGALDLTRPVAISLVAVLHFLSADDQPYDIVGRLLDAVPAGSYLVATHGTADFDPGARRLYEAYRARGIHLQSRDRDEFGRFFAGLDLVEPGVTVAHRWRPDDAVPPDLTDALVSNYAAVGRKP
ncbi:SAM-dependent methyltransferase [Frankia sp. AgB32]|uniref:SAM-dependent methyltransferase n=1 Tax=Frankia sp. AgB32 TaxID=631119 RepID=UPI0020104E43|nr:SAM-dependent methyltransferase [Frankia sp. AgB32]MCK9895303.1 SAM-dependent methyltransferase [Frankia sp. AgB32]